MSAEHWALGCLAALGTMFVLGFTVIPRAIFHLADVTGLNAYAMGCAGGALYAAIMLGPLVYSAIVR